MLVITILWDNEKDQFELTISEGNNIVQRSFDKYPDTLLVRLKNYVDKEVSRR